MAVKPQFTSTPNVGQGALSVANTNRDGTGALVDVFTAGAAGSRVDKIVVKATGSTTAGMVRIFVKLGAGTARLLTEVPVSAITPAANLPGFETVVDLLGGIPLPSGAKLQAATHNAEAFVLTACGGDF